MEAANSTQFATASHAISSEFLGSASEAHCPARLGPGGASEIQDLGRGGAGWNRTTCTPHARCGVNGTNRPPLLYSATVLDEY